MKKRVLLLLPLFLGACSDSGESPVITIERLYVNTDPDSEDSKGEDYTNQKDNLPALKVGDKVNVERSMMMNGRLDGHIVQGHVDQTATCIDIKDAEGSWYFTFRYAFDKEMAKRGYITVDKGSVTVNGVSLTVCNPTDDTFQVAIIPYTYEYTNFHTFTIGSVVNIEFDIIGKYISRMIQYK